MNLFDRRIVYVSMLQNFYVNFRARRWCGGDMPKINHWNDRTPHILFFYSHHFTSHITLVYLPKVLGVYIETRTSPGIISAPVAVHGCWVAFHHCFDLVACPVAVHRYIIIILIFIQLRWRYKYSKHSKTSTFFS